MGENERVLDFISKGNTLEGLNLLFGHGGGGEDPLLRLNSALYSPSGRDFAEQVRQAEETHLERLHTRNDRERGLLLYNLGCFALYQDEIQTAKFRFDEAARLRPEMVQAYHNLGYARELMAEFEGAKAAYRRVLEARPDYALSRINLGQILIQEGQREEGLTELRLVVAGQPENIGAALYFCRAILSGGESEAAREVLELLRNRPDWLPFPDLKECLGFAHYLVGERQRAEEIFRELLSENDAHLFPRMGLIKILAAREAHGDLSTHAERYQQLSPSPGVAGLIAKLGAQAPRV